MKFREARREDLPAVVALLADDPLGATREKFEDPLPAEYTDAFEAMQRQGGNRLIVVEGAGGDILGFLQLTFTPGIARLGMTRATIEGVRVAAGQRGEGLGEKLFLYAIDEARMAGCGLVQLTTDVSRPDAHRFYEKLGFEASHTGMKLKL